MNNETGPPVAAYPGQYQGYDPSIDPERFNNKANASCRFCHHPEPVEDLIKPCNCIGNRKYAHRDCINEWRVVSPYPNALSTCEVCNADYLVIHTQKSIKVLKRCTIFRIVLDIFIYFLLIAIAIFALGFIGNAALSPETMFNVSTSFGSWLAQQHFMARVVMWGFIWFFALIGIIGVILCCCNCAASCCGCYGDSFESASESYFDPSRSSCCWVMCGPTYYDDRYYSSPFQRFSCSDFLCACCISWSIWNCCRACKVRGNECGTCDCGSSMDSCCCAATDCDCNGDGDGGWILLLIILAIFVAIGVFVGTMVSLMLISKIIKRRIDIYYRKIGTKKQTIVDLEDTDSVSKALKEREQRIMDGDHPVLPTEGVDTLVLE